MPKGELFINKNVFGDWQDAYLLWGVSLTDMGMSAFMAPPPNKEYIVNDSRLENGRRVLVSNTKVASRDISLPIHIKAPSREIFYERYSLFCEELKKGSIWIKTKYSDVVYKCVYRSCSQYTQFIQQMAHLTLKLEEPNPCDRIE